MLCRDSFDTLTAKRNHICPEKEKTTCQDNCCPREPKDESGYCNKHKPLAHEHIEPEKETEEYEVLVREIGWWNALNPLLVCLIVACKICLELEPKPAMWS